MQHLAWDQQFACRRRAASAAFVAAVRGGSDIAVVPTRALTPTGR